METKRVDFDDKYIKWFAELSNKNVDIVGGKGASLGEMYNHKFPVPQGFVATAQSFEYFIGNSGLKERIANIIIGIDMENTSELTEKAKEIREMIIEQNIPDDLKKEILEAYHILGTEKIDEKGVSSDALTILKNSQEPIFVSVRSSATTEDLVDASFAGQQQSFLNVKGDHQLIEYIKKCFASLYTARAIYYRNKKGFKEEESLLAVVVQKMVDSEKSGVVFSRDPVNLDENIVIEAVYGLGEGIVSGKIKPDHYIVSRDLHVQKVKTADKKIAIVRTGSGENEIVKLSLEKSRSQVLSNAQILEVGDYAIKLEEHYGKPQDIEFGIEEDKVYILQSRPITTLKAKEKTGKISGNVILKGEPASPGIGVGVVKIINTMDDLSKIKKGDILVTKMTNPDMVVSMQKSNAIVTDEGGITSHASIVSREMGIPAVVGADGATERLKDGMKITVNGSTGKIYEGAVAETTLAEIKPVIETSKVKLKVIVDLPDFAERAAESKIDSVGLMRLEGVIASSGKHPLQYEKENKLEEYTQLLREGIEKIAEYFKLVWIRSSDIRSDEYGTLEGAPEEEINPMLGFHGIRFSLKHLKIFEAELLAVKQVAEKYPDKKIGIMFPQIISVEEIKQAKEYFDKIKLPNIQFGVMIETPASVQIIEDICKENVDFVSFGTNDLTQFTLGVDRGNDDVQYLYDESHPAILSQIKKVIEVCKKYNIETSICGQAGSKKEIVKFLFKNGIDSISVNADAGYDVSVLIKELEDSFVEEVAPVIEEKIEEPKPIYERKFEKEKPVEFKEKFVEAKPKRKKWGFNIICSECGKEATVPFKPRENQDNLCCKECYKKKKALEKELKQEPIKPVDNFEGVEERVKEIKGARAEDVQEDIEEPIEEKNEGVEEPVEKSEDGGVSGAEDNNIGVYNPPVPEENKYEYSFDNNEDEFSEVF